jgi:hypothetical protein
MTENNTSRPAVEDRPDTDQIEQKNGQSRTLALFGVVLVVILGLGYIATGGLTDPSEKLITEFKEIRQHEISMCLVDARLGNQNRDCYCEITKELGLMAALHPRVRSYPDLARRALKLSVEQDLAKSCS